MNIKVMSSNTIFLLWKMCFFGKIGCGLDFLYRKLKKETVCVNQLKNILHRLERVRKIKRVIHNLIFLITIRYFYRKRNVDIFRVLF